MIKKIAHNNNNKNNFFREQLNGPPSLNIKIKDKKSLSVYSKLLLLLNQRFESKFAASV